ncbi:MAG: phosphoribosyltransferase [Proteobacteria bacterium]|nr:phosphoribosyltransferase [Pseudomonadota bacterium]
MDLPVKNRKAAGEALAQALQEYAGRDDVFVLALPRGGVPVAVEVAKALDAGLDLMLVRKLGVPGQKELVMGAIASGGSRVMNEAVVRSLNISEEAIKQVEEAERKELRRREQAYRGERPWPVLAGCCVILVDDGLATGATMRAAVDAVRQSDPAHLVVAVPVAPADTLEMLARQVDNLVCLAVPEYFRALGLWYVDFSQVSDDEVRHLLEKTWNE